MVRNFQRKRVWSEMLHSKSFLILFGIVLLFFAWNILGLWNKMQDTEKNKNLVENQITNLQQQQQKLTSDINNLNTDQGKERIFRENFGLAKSGEGEIVILDDKNLPPSPPTSSGFWGFWKNLFK